jgi:hypothetical protein
VNDRERELVLAHGRRLHDYDPECPACQKFREALREEEAETMKFAPPEPMGFNGEWSS